MSLTRIASLPGSSAALGIPQLEPMAPQFTREQAVARALRKMEIALAHQGGIDRARAILDKSITLQLTAAELAWRIGVPEHPRCCCSVCRPR